MSTAKKMLHYRYELSGSAHVFVATHNALGHCGFVDRCFCNHNAKTHRTNPTHYFYNTGRNLLLVHVAAMDMGNGILCDTIRALQYWGVHDFVRRHIQEATVTRLCDLFEHHWRNCWIGCLAYNIYVSE